MTPPVTAVAPGRVNVIGDHTDYAGGNAFPVAIDLATTATFTTGGDGLRIRSTTTGADVTLDADAPQPAGSFGAMIAGLLDVIGERNGVLEVSSTLPLGAGLSSSASLLIAGALALGVEQRGLELARLCQHAEHLAGQDVGLLDQMAIIEGQVGHGILIDFSDLSCTALAIPDGLEIIVIHSGEDRSLASGAYAERRREVAAAEGIIGSIPGSVLGDIEDIEDPRLRRRARHVWSECARVTAFAESISSDRVQAGRLMTESHRSLSELFEVSTPRIDALVADLVGRPGVLGARMTGGGFGGCIVALTDLGALDPASFDRAWRVAASEGARLTSAA